MLRDCGGLPYSVPNPNNEPIKITNVMSNADRKRMELPIDEALEKLPCDKCQTEDILTLIYKDGKSIYLCQKCLNEKDS